MINTAAMTKAVECSLRRNKHGVEIFVRVLPEIEEFFQQWGGGVQANPAFGRSWKPVDSEPLRFWSFDVNMPGLSEEQFTLIPTGSSLFDDGGRINVSFLRFVGASSDVGRKFVIEQVMSRTELDRIAQRFAKAFDAFYTNYVQHVHLNVFVSVLDVSKVPNGE